MQQPHHYDQPFYHLSPHTYEEEFDHSPFDEYHFALPLQKSHSIRLPAKTEAPQTPPEPAPATTAPIPEPTPKAPVKEADPAPTYTVRPTSIPPLDMYHHHDESSDDEHSPEHILKHVLDEQKHMVHHAEEHHKVPLVYVPLTSPLTQTQPKAAQEEQKPPAKDIEEVKQPAPTAPKTEATKPTTPEPKPTSAPTPIGDPVKPTTQPVVQLVKPLAPIPQPPSGSSTEFESGYMSGYERGIAAERELLMKEFEHKRQATPFDIPEAEEHHEPAENDYFVDHYDRYHHIPTNEQLVELYHINNLMDPNPVPGSDGGVNIVD